MQEKQEEDLQQVFNKAFEVGLDEVGRSSFWPSILSSCCINK